MGCDIAMEFLEFNKYFPYICRYSSDFRKVAYLTEPNSQLCRNSDLRIKIFFRKKNIFVTYVLFPNI